MVNSNRAPAKRAGLGLSVHSRLLLSSASIAVIAAAATPFPAAADDMTISTAVAGGNGGNGNGKLGGTGGAAGMGAGQGGNGGDGGDGGSFNRGAEGTSGTGGGAGGNIWGSGAANGGGGSGGAGTEIDNGVGGDGGGGGGGGGNGLIATGAHNITVLGAGSIHGGNGGNGYFQGNGQGAGGGGGDGITLTGSNGSRIENSEGAAITGGGGGNGNNTMNTGGGGGDGISIQGNDNIIINAGSIFKGTGSAFANLPRDGNAISIAGNNNRLELWATSTINGAVVANGTGNVFALGGAANGMFDMSTLGSQYRGFSGLKKTGTGTWALSGDGSSFGSDTTVDGGVLRADSSTAFANSTDYVVNNGILDLGGFDLVMSSLSGTGGEVAIGAANLTVDQAIDTSFAGRLSGSGTFVKDGTGVLTLSGDSSAFSGTTNLQAGTLVLDGVLGGTIEAYGDSVLGVAAADAISGIFDTQTFHDNGTLNAQAASAISGSTQQFWNTSTLNAKVTDAIVGGEQTFNENSVLNASAIGAIADGTQVFNDDSVLNATEAGAISGGWQDFYGDSSLNASATGAIVYGSQSFGSASKLNAGAGSIAGGDQGFWEDSELNAIGANAVKAGEQTFRDASTLNASIANAIAGGTQEFYDDSTLNATAEDAVSGGTQSFYGDSILNAGAGSIADGVQSFIGRSVLNAGAANAVNGGSQSFGGFTTLNATAANAISGGVQDFSWFATLNAGAGGIVGGEQTFRDAGTLNVLATNALATTTDIRFETTGTLKLNGFSTTIGRINSLSGGAGIITNDGATDGALSVNTSVGASVFTGVIQNGSGIRKLGLVLAAGDLTLGGANTYTGGTAVDGGTLRAAAAGAFVGNTGYVVNGGTLALNGFALTMSSLSGTGGTVAFGTANLTADQATNTTFAGKFTGTGDFVKRGAGTLTLTGDSSAFDRTTRIFGGTLRVNGTLGGSVVARTDGALSGSGRIVGDADLTGGGVLVGSTGQTLRIDGALVMDASSAMNVTLGAASSSALADVGDHLTLNGTLNVADAGGFGAGVYRLFNYGGSLGGPGLTIGTMPVGLTDGDLGVQTSVGGKVNLISSAGAELGFWDGGDVAHHDNGAVDGGSGVWQATGRDWTQSDGALNGRFNPNPTFAVFQGNSGMVTVDDAAGAISVTGMQIASGGYTLAGDSISLGGAGGQSVIRVGDGTGASAGMTATIASSLTGNSMLVKSDFGMLALNGVNTYTGGTRIDAGVLAVGADASLGNVAGGIVLNGGTLGAFEGFDTDRSIVLNAAGRFEVSNGKTLGLRGTVGGPGDLVKRGGGTMVLSGANTYGGDTQVQAGTLIGSTSSIRGDIGNAGTVIFDQGTNASLAGSIAGLGGTNGTMVKRGAGTLTLTGSSALGWTIETGGLIANAGRFAGNAAIHSAAWLTFDQSAGAAYAGILSGSGNLTVSGSGALTLTGNSAAFAGNSTVVEAALRVNGTLGGDVAIRNSGVLSGTGYVMGNADLTGSGVLAGVSGQTLRVGGNLTMDATSTTHAALGSGSNAALFDVGGNLTLDGTLNVANAGGFAAGIYRLFDYGGMLSDNGLEIGTPPAGVAVSDLSLQTSVSGRVNLVSVSGAELGFWDGGNAALHDNGVVDGGAGVWRADGRNWTRLDGRLNGRFQPNPTFAVFQGTGGVVTVDPTAGAIGVLGMQFDADGYRLQGGAIALEGATGQTIIRVGDGTVSGAGMTATVATELTGASALVKSDYGTLILTGANRYTGGTFVQAGTLIGTAGSLRGDIGNAGTVIFDQGANASFAGAIAGLGGVDGAMIKRGAGTLTLTGGSTLGWTVETGGLVANAGRFGGDAAIQAGARLTFDQSAGATYAGVLSGSGSFALSGSGTVTVTGNSSAFSGITTVGAGSGLIIGTAAGGKLGGSMTFGTGSLLGGTGTIGQAGSTVMIATGAVHAPGNSIGVQHVAGDYVNRGTLRIEATPTAADKIVVAGGVDIAGAALDLVLAPTDASGWNVFSGPFTILDQQGAGAVIGRFNPVTKALLFLDTVLDYAGGDGNDVTLELVRNDIAFGHVGNTSNQIATGAAIDALGNGNSLWRSIALTNDANVVRASFDALSGEIHASAKTAMIEDSRFVRNAVDDRIRAAFDGVGANGGAVVTYDDNGPRASAGTTDRFAVWGQAFGSWGHVDSDGNAARLNRSTGGFFIGADAPVFDTWRFGAVTGFSRASFNANARHSSGMSDNYHLGVYGGTAGGDLAFRTGAAYTWHGMSTRRMIAIPGVSDSFKSDYSAATAQVFAELGYEMQAGNVAFEPFGSLAYVNFHTDGFTESGGIAALSGASGSTDTTFTTLGIRAATAFEFGGANLTAKGMVGWRHAFGDVTPDSTMRFTGSGNAFQIAGVPVAGNAAVIEAGLDYAITPNAMLGVSYNGQFGSGLSDQSARVNFNVKF